MIMATENRTYFRRTDAFKVEYTTNIKENTFKLPLNKQVPEMK